MIYPFVARIYYRKTSNSENLRTSGQKNIYHLRPIKECAPRLSRLHVHSPYSIPGDTLWGSKDRIVMDPVNTTEIETGYETDVEREAICGSNTNTITVVTEIGVESSQKP